VWTDLRITAELYEWFLCCSNLPCFENIQGILYVFDNNCSGNIPSEIGQMTTLLDLRLGSTSMSGTLPSEIGQLLRLDTFSLHNATIQGVIPTEIGRLSNLIIVGIVQTNITGPAISELMHLPRLTQLYLYENLLTGIIPPSVPCQNYRSLSFMLTPWLERSLPNYSC
jgi:Leucine-rich repeat (LRR) protein